MNSPYWKRESGRREVYRVLMPMSMSISAHRHIRIRIAHGTHPHDTHARMWRVEWRVRFPMNSKASAACCSCACLGLSDDSNTNTISWPSIVILSTPAYIATELVHSLRRKKSLRVPVLYSLPPSLHSTLRA